MKKISSIVFAIAVLITNSHALFIIDSEENKVQDNQISNNNEKYPGSCLIMTEKNGKSYIGTGTFLSKNVVLTIAHVILSEDKKLLTPSNITIKNNEKIYSIEKILKYPGSIYERCGEKLSTKTDTFALLILEENSYNPLEDFHPIRSLDILGKPPTLENYLEYEDAKPKSLTVMGYGEGGLIKKDSFYEKDLTSSIFPSLSFRYQENIPGEEFSCFNTFPIISLDSKAVKLATGDSGACLLDENKNVIGVIMEGTARFGNKVNELREQIEKEGSIEGLKNNKEAYGKVINSSNVEEAYKEYINNVKRNCIKKFNNEMVEHSKTGWFSSDFIVFDDLSSQWVNKIIKENPYSYKKFQWSLPLNSPCVIL